MTSLDLLIAAAMVLAAASLAAMTLMFLVKSRKVRRVCLYIVAGLGVYLGYVGSRINWPGFVPQVVLAVAMALVCIAAIVLEHRSGENANRHLTARLLASAALIAGMVNAFA